MTALRIVLLTVVVTGTVAAQEYSLLLGGVHTRYADSVSGSAGRAAGRLDVRGTFWSLRVEGGAAQFTAGGMALNGSLSGMGLRPLGGRVGLGLAAAAAGLSVQQGHSGLVAAGPTMLVAVGRTAWQLTGTVGLIRDLGGTVWNLAGASTVTRIPLGRVEFLAGVVGTRSDTLTWGDITARATIRQGSVELRADMGLRAGDLANDPWGGARVAWQMVPSVAIEVAGGRYPRDLTGFGAGTYVDVGVRLRKGATRASAATPDTHLRGPVRVERMADGRVRLRVPYRGDADLLSIAGPFSDWQPVPMVRRRAGEWEAVLRLPSGVTEYVLVVAGRFVLPDGVVGVDDGLGGRAGRLWIP